MVAKIQQTDKTVVTEFMIQVADIFTRQRHAKGSISVKVPQTSNFVQADANVSLTQQVVIMDITCMVMINSWSPILLDLTNPSGVITSVPCSGLFINYGQFTAIRIRGLSATPTRLTYVYA
jgi:hypothetical protein